MPRMGRTVLPDCSHHLVQLGHNRQVALAEKADYTRYPATVPEFKNVYGVKLYAYCLIFHAAIPEVARMLIREAVQCG